MKAKKKMNTLKCFCAAETLKTTKIVQYRRFYNAGELIVYERTIIYSALFPHRFIIEDKVRQWNKYCDFFATGRRGGEKREKKDSQTMSKAISEFLSDCSSRHECKCFVFLSFFPSMMKYKLLQ